MFTAGKGLSLWGVEGSALFCYSKVLTQQLRELEEDGLITRTVYPQVPPKVVYSLTPYGKDLEDTLRLMEKWGQSHQKKVGENFDEDVSEAELS